MQPSKKFQIDVWISTAKTEPIVNCVEIFEREKDWTLQLFLSSSFVQRFIDDVQFSFWLIFFVLVSFSFCSFAFDLFVLVAFLFNSFKLNLWLQKHDWHIFDQHLRTRENTFIDSNDFTKSKSKKWSILKLRKRFLASVSLIAFFFLPLILAHFMLLKLQPPSKPSNLYDNHLCFVRFHFSYFFFSFLEIEFFSCYCLVAGFYQINPLGLVTFFSLFILSCSTFTSLHQCANRKYFVRNTNVVDK